MSWPLTGSGAGAAVVLAGRCDFWCGVGALGTRGPHLLPDWLLLGGLLGVGSGLLDLPVGASYLDFEPLPCGFCASSLCGHAEAKVGRLSRGSWMSDPECEGLAVEFGGLSIRISKAPDRRASTGSAAAGSFTVVSSAPSLSALASPDRGTEGRAGEAWSEEWCDALLRASTPEDFEAIDLGPVNHLLGRLRARTGTSGWTPAARLGRALRAGLAARYKLDHEEGAYSASPYPSIHYIVLRGAPRKSAGWTEDYSTFLAAVRGPFTAFHPDAVCHGFPSRAEGEAYCLGAGRVRPAPLQRLA